MAERTLSRTVDEFTDDLILVLSKYDTETLEKLSDERERIGGVDDWMRTMIREYLSVWR